MAGAVVVDPDGVYDPALMNDRLLLGLKGTLNAYELDLLRQRSLEAIRQKARRGELRFCLPVGYVWTAHGKIEMDPDQRIQQALHFVFSKMTELGSVRQVLLWFRRERIELPMRTIEEPNGQIVWALPVYHTVHRFLTNPIYAGAYAFGKTQAKTVMIDGRARKTSGHKKPQTEWTVLLRDHHSGYISWEQFERNQAMIADNAYMKSRMQPKAGRGGKALLSGLLRCRRCGRMLTVSYGGTRRQVPRYHCKGAQLNHGEDWCISFGSLRTDQSVAEELLRAIGGNAVEAALEAAEKLRQQRHDRHSVLELELEQARYEAKLSARRYEAVDPDNRLVAAELEARWNAALTKVRELEDHLQKFDLEMKLPAIPDKEVLVSLAQNLPAVWNSPNTDMRLKQRIVRILIREIVADVDQDKKEIALLIHWVGGQHSELRVKKNGLGKHRRCTSADAVDIVRQMAGKYSDERIAATLNCLKLRTGVGNNWNEQRVASLRHYHALPAYSPQAAPKDMLTLEETASRLGVSKTSVRRMIRENLLPAHQVVPCAPWQIPVQAVHSADVQKAVDMIKSRANVTRTQNDSEGPLLFSIS
jgi:excisionase family DNA binding protein